jgi:hypothetical protein
MARKLLLPLMALLVLGIAPAALAKDPDQAPKGRVPAEVDYNSDGKVSLKEHLAWENVVFTESDLNGDGFITTAEVAQKQMDMLVKMRKARGEPAEFSEQDMSFIQGNFSPAIDTNGDRQVSLKEHLAWETKNFQANDLNGDGAITWKEVQERRAMIASELKQAISAKRYQQNPEAKRPNAGSYQD